MAVLPESTQLLRELTKTVGTLIGMVALAKASIRSKSADREDIELAVETLKHGVAATAVALTKEGVDEDFTQFQGTPVEACGHHGLSGHELSWRIVIGIQGEIRGMEKLASELGSERSAVDVWLGAPDVLLDRYNPFPVERLDTMLREEGQRTGESILAGDSDENNSNQREKAISSQGGGEKTAKEKAFETLKEWAQRELKGKQRRVIELTVDAGGECAISDLAIDSSIEWQAPYDDAFNGIRKALKPKLAKQGWCLDRNDNKGRLARIGHN